MSKDLDGLKEKYRLLYAGPVYFECGPGWYDILDELSDKLETEILRMINSGYTEFLPYVKQVKEKFGGLRFYMSTETDAMTKAIAEAEAKSETICEMCGCPGKIKRNHFWLKIRCENCE